MFAETVEKVKKHKLVYLPQYLERVHFKIADVTRMVKYSREIKSNVRQLKYQTNIDVKDIKCIGWRKSSIAMGQRSEKWNRPLAALELKTEWQVMKQSHKKIG